MYGLYFDPTMIILLPGIIISFIAQGMVKSAYRKYNEIGTVNGYTGLQVARSMLDNAGLYDIRIEMTNGELTDHYSPKERVLRLSEEVYNGRTISSAGIAAHEVGHAIQHKESYSPLKIRDVIIPVANFGSSFSWILFFVGILFSIKPLISIGILLFTTVIAFQLITLPVEFDASKRALRNLNNSSILHLGEMTGAKKVLNAAAMTYVAGVLMSILQLVRLIAISNRKD